MTKVILKLSLIVLLIASFVRPSPLSSTSPSSTTTKANINFDTVNKKSFDTKAITTKPEEIASNQLNSNNERVQTVSNDNINETKDNKARGESHDGEKISRESELKKQKEEKKLLAGKNGTGTAYSSLLSKKMIKNNFTMSSFSNDTTFWENNKTHELYLPFKVRFPSIFEAFQLKLMAFDSIRDRKIVHQESFAFQWRFLGRHR
jgi:hypothetical protein